MKEALPEVIDRPNPDRLMEQQGPPAPEVAQRTLPEVYEASWNEQLRARAHNVGRYATRNAQKRTARALIIGVIGGTLAPVAAAEAQTSVVDPGQFRITTTTTIRGAEDQAAELVEKRIVVGEDVMMKKGVNRKKCHWTKGAFTNSVRLANGKLKYFRDSKRGYLCRSSRSPTGWVKVKGGEWGGPCYNPAKDKPIPEGKTEVLSVRDLDTPFVLNADADADAAVVCPGAIATGRARGSARQVFTYRAYMRQSGSSRSQHMFELKDRAIANAQASARCISTETTTTTTTPIAPPYQPPVTTRPNTPPQVKIQNPALHVIDTDQQQFCAIKFDAEGSRLIGTWSAVSGNVSTPYNPEPVTQPNKECVTYTPADLPANSTSTDTVTVSVFDGQYPASDSTTFQTVDNNIRPF